MTPEQKQKIFELLKKYYLEELQKKIDKLKSQNGTKGGSVLPETDTNIQQVKIEKEPVIRLRGGGNKCNPWIEHVKTVKENNPSLKYKDVLKKAKETYQKKAGGAMTSHDYETRIEDPIKTQEKILKPLKNTKPYTRKPKPVGEKTQTMAPVKSKVGPRKGKLLDIKATKKTPDGVQSVTKLQIKTKPPRKTLAEQLRLAEERQDLILTQPILPEREGAEVKSATFGSREETVPIFGRGMKSFETKLLKEIEQKIKGLPKQKAIVVIKNHVNQELKQKGWKPVEIKPVLTMILDKFTSMLGGANPLVIKSALETMEKAGIFEASKSALNTLTKRLDEIISNPEKTKERNIWSRDIPNLKSRYDKLKNIYDLKGHTWTDFRKANHTIRMRNIQADITKKINMLAGIEILRSSGKI